VLKSGSSPSRLLIDAIVHLILKSNRLQTIALVQSSNWDVLITDHAFRAAISDHLSLTTVVTPSFSGSFEFDESSIPWLCKLVYCPPSPTELYWHARPLSSAIKYGLRVVRMWIVNEKSATFWLNTHSQYLEKLEEVYITNTCDRSTLPALQEFARTHSHTSIKLFQPIFQPLLLPLIKLANPSEYPQKYSDGRNDLETALRCHPNSTWIHKPISTNYSPQSVPQLMCTTLEVIFDAMRSGSEAFAKIISMLSTIVHHFPSLSTLTCSANLTLSVTEEQVRLFLTTTYEPYSNICHKIQAFFVCLRGLKSLQNLSIFISFAESSLKHLKDIYALAFHVPTLRLVTEKNRLHGKSVRYVVERDPRTGDATRIREVRERKSWFRTEKLVSWPPMESISDII